MYINDVQCYVKEYRFECTCKFANNTTYNFIYIKIFFIKNKKYERYKKENFRYGMLHIYCVEYF